MSARKPSEAQGIAWGLFAVLASALISHLVRPFAELTDLIMIHLLGVVLIAMRFSMAVSLATAVLSILSFDLLFIPPSWIFNYPGLKSAVTFIVMIIVAGVISKLTERLRREQAASERSAATTLSLYRLAQDLGGATRVEQLVALAVRHLERAFGARVQVLIGDAPGQEAQALAAGLSEPDLADARQAASRPGVVVKTAPGSGKVFQPLLGLHGPVGVVVLFFDRRPDDDDLRLVVALATQLASAIERISLGSAVQRAQVQIETERTRNALLSTVSHDLKTPLSAIIAAGTTLANQESHLDRATRTTLTHTIVEAAERLDGLVTNLLSATRMESGTIVLTKSVEALDELVGAVLSHFAERLGGRGVNLDVPADLPLLSVDPQLIELVLINLVENALRYTPSGRTITLRGERVPVNVRLVVRDTGKGIPPEDIPSIFDRFWRGDPSRSHSDRSG